MKLKLTTLCMALLLVCGQVFAAGGKCGKNLRWKLKNDVLSISGTGAMDDYTYDRTPWSSYRKSITSVKINEGVTSIGENAFSNCTGLTSVTIPNSVTSIGWGAFHSCLGLTSVTFGNSVICIGDCAFLGCYRLTSITIPNSVTSIGPFSGCSGLTSIVVENGNTKYDSRDNCNAIIETSTHTLIAGCKNTIIPNSVTSIGDGAFIHNGRLTSITIPNSVTSIGADAFYGCSGLTSVTIPNSVTSIGKSAFYGCSGLTSVTIPNSVTSIGADAFYGCSGLTSVTIPNSVTSIGKSAFYGCVKLREIKYPKGLDLSIAKIPTTTKLIAYDPSVGPQNSTPSPKQFPLLALVDGSLKFNDANANNRIDADEKCSLKFRVANKGKGAAQNCEARVKISGATNGITVKTVKLPTIAAGNNYEVSVPVTSNINTINGQVSLAIEIYEPNGFGVEPFAMNVSTKAYDPPYLQIVDYQVSSVSGKIRKMEPFIVTCNLQNTKYGNAENVTVHVNIPANIFLVEGEETVTIPQVKSGEVVNLKFGFLANTNYNTGSVPITFEVKEKHGKFAENKQLAIALNQTSSSTINIAAKEEAEQERQEIQLAMIKSDVDRNIPTAKTKNANTFVLIIANEHYSHVASVPFALNDGNIFREYCVKTLGIGEKHIKYLSDATGNDIKTGVNWLANLTEAFDNPQIIVYYAGHGIPDEASKSAYLLPVDGSGTDVSTGYKLDELYATLGNMPASRITVFMDACFSGSKREEGMLASARGVALKTKSGVPQGKMVVFSAAQGDETAYPNREQQHGMFTYYLLKKLQETEGNVGLKDLGDYVTKQVTQQSLLLNSKKQTPSVIPSAEVGTDWENWKLK